MAPVHASVTFRQPCCSTALGSQKIDDRQRDYSSEERLLLSLIASYGMDCKSAMGLRWQCQSRCTPIIDPHASAAAMHFGIFVADQWRSEPVPSMPAVCSWLRGRDLDTRAGKATVAASVQEA